jgi:hypothetical protein
MKDLISFYTKRLLSKTIVSNQLGFHSELENRFFEAKLRGCKRYLEWGAGASTLVAGQLGISTFSIDSDKIFLEAVRKTSCSQANVDIQLVHRDIGLIGPWGTPVISWFAPVTVSRAAKFREYSDPPRFNSHDECPDLILIDGKFRVACALKVMREFYKIGYTNYEVIIDDYRGRPQYHVVNQWFDVSFVGVEMAVASPRRQLDTKTLDKLIETYELDAA